MTLSACSFGGTPSDQASSASSQAVSSESDIQETKNVSYRGTLEKQGVSIFMEGTHRLRLDDGRFVLLESDTVILNDYLNMKVEVVGAVRPTVENGGLIMRVERVMSLEVASSSVSDTIFCGGIAAFPCPASMQCVDDPDDSCDPENGGADCGGICVAASVSSADTITPTQSSATSVASIASSRPVVSSIATVSSAAPVPVPVSSAPSEWQASTDLTAKAAVMAKDNMDPSLWTQKYCSSHIGYCFPVHKNWWFFSFGATSSTFWHVEVGPSEINNLGDGPLTVDLVSGNIANDGSVVVSGDTATGFRSWTGGRHLEVRGPANLETAVRYITEQLKAQN